MMLTGSRSRLDAANLPVLTGHFLDLKHHYFPSLRYPSLRPLDRILPEIKGSDNRRSAIRGSARQQHHAIGFLDRILGLLRHNDVRLVARVWVKGIGSPFDPTSVYTSSIHNPQTDRHEGGIVVSDAIARRNGSFMFR